MPPVITLNKPLPQSGKLRLRRSLKLRLLLVLALGIFLILKLTNIAPKLSDEGFYFYNANLIAQGQLPYQDFFFQHLPGQILFLAGIIKTFGYNLYLLKTIPILASIGTATLLYRMTRNFITPILYLFSLSVLATTDHSTGVHEAVFLLVLTWLLLDRQKFFWAGLVLFLALTYRIYVLPAALGITLYHLWKDSRYQVPGFSFQAPGNRLTGNRQLAPGKPTKWLVFLLTSLIPFSLVNLTLWQTYGEKFLTPVWRYHFLKSEGIDKGKIFSFFLANEWMLLALALTGLVVFLITKSKFQNPKSKTNSNDQNPNSKLNKAALFGLLAQGAFLLVFADIYYFYLVTLIPFLAVLAVYSIRSLTSPKSLILFLAAFAIINFYNYQTNHAPVSVLTNLDRIKGDVKGLTKEDDPPSGEAGTVWGSFVVTPLIALESDRKITENQVDTNAKRNYAGLLSSDEATRLATESALFIQTATLDTSGKILSLEPDYVKQYVIQDSCTLFRTYPIPRDYEKNAILLWQCRRP